MAQQPNLSALLEQWWGGSYANYAVPNIILAASNLVTGDNPAYGPNEFFATYPQYGGAPIDNLVGQLTLGNAVIAVNATVSSLEIGQYISDQLVGIPASTTINAISGQNVTLSNAAVQTVVDDRLLVYPTPAIPYPVLLMYINLAQSCVQYNRWLEWWPMGMGLFIAHYVTLYLYSQGAPGSPPGQAALAGMGMARGILTSKSAGDVSAGYSPIMTTGWENWGAWSLTLYGQQFMTMARMVGFGWMYVW
jgi:hypothetical protein